MSFLYPAFLAAAAAIAIPIVLHLLRRDLAPEVPFSAVRLLRKSPIERSKRRRLRDLLLLAARVAALALLAVAFARPYLYGAAGQGTRVIAVDRSYSMGAPGVFDRARQLARQAIDEGPAGQRVAVIAFDDRADLASDPGTKADARAALDSVSPGYGGTRYAPVIQKAIELGEGAPVSLVLVTDLQRAGWQDQQPLSLPPGMRVEVRAAGELAGNLAVRAVDVEPDRVVAELQNDWTAQKAGQVRLLQNGRTIAAASYSLAPSSAAEVPIPAKIPASGALAVAIEDSGGIPADDVRYRMLGGGSQPGMLIVAGGAANGFYITRALEAIGDDDDGFAVARVSGAAFSSMKSDALAGTALVVLASTRGIDRRGRDHLIAFTRAGGGLLVTGAPDVEGTLLSNTFAWTPALSTVDVRNEPLTFAATDPRHPIFRPFGPLLANLGQVRFERTWRVVPDGWRVIARFSDGSPALVERIEGKGRVLLFASDLDRRWNDFPLNPAFVPFVIEAARYTAGPQRQANDFTVGAVPPGVEPRPGVYEIDREKGSVAVNVDPREGALGRLTVDEFQGMLKPSEAAPAAVRLQAQHIEAGQSYWRYGLLLMLAALVAESVAGRVRA